MASSVLAVVAAFLFSAAVLSSKRGSANMNSLSGLAISLPSGLAFSLIVALILAPRMFNLRGVVLYACAGLLASGLGRFLLISGVGRMRTTSYVPAQASAYVLTGALGGVIAFGESLGATRALGILAVAGGVAIGSSSDRDPPLPRTAHLSLLFPIGAGVTFGSADIVAKSASLSMPPLWGTVITLATASAVWAIILASSRRARHHLVLGLGWRWFVLHGLLTTMAIFVTYLALARGDVSVVGPVIASQPVATVILALLFLRDVERPTTRVAVGSVIVAVGAGAVGLS